MILVAPELARMVGHHLIVEENHDALGIGAHQHHTAGSPRIDAVAIMIGHDQASGAGPHGFLDKPRLAQKKSMSCQSLALDAVSASARSSFGEIRSCSLFRMSLPVTCIK